MTRGAHVSTIGDVAPRFRVSSRFSVATLGLFVALGAGEAWAKKPKRGKDKIDPSHSEAVAQYITDPSYSTPWVDHLPTSRKVKSPKEYLGYHIGTPGKLTKPETINAYFRQLAKDSKRVKVFSMGKSHGGREMIVAAIGSKKNLKKLDKIKSNSGLTEAERQRLCEAAISNN